MDRSRKTADDKRNSRVDGGAMICPKCSYEWESRKPNPKACPRCKARLDYKPKKKASK